MQKSLLKALNVIEHMSLIGNEVGVTELAKLLELNKSNVHDILASFEVMGFVKKNPVTKRYSLGNKFLEVAHSISKQQPFRAVACRELSQLAQSIGEICHFAIPYKDRVMYLEVASPSSSLLTNHLVGSTTPMSSNGIGKAILAHLPQPRIEQVLNAVLEESSDSDIIAMQHQLQAIRELGYCIDKHESVRELGYCIDKHESVRELGYCIDKHESVREMGYCIDEHESDCTISCVAVPILDANGIIQGALSITAPASRLSESRIPELVKQLSVSASVIANSF